MKNNFELKYSPEFYNDFYSINFYIKYKLKNSIAAENLLKKVEKEIRRRLENPLGFEQYKTNAGNIYYRIYISNYIVFYTITDNVMEIRRIIYSKRDFENLI